MNELQADQLITRAGWIVDALREINSTLNFWLMLINLTLAVSGFLIWISRRQ
jgi:hypothetical protein